MVIAGPTARRLVRIAALAAGVLALAARAEAQLGALVSPGPLAKAHASLEGVANCEKCHERGRKVTAERCLVCHQAIAQRIALKKGVHRSVTNDCVQCHVEHAGVDGELRPFNRATFDHAAVTGFALDGRHAVVAAKCESCHKTRSYLTASPSCSACHADVHKGSLGPTCEKCHSTKVAFTAATNGFDHGTTAFPLVGAHRRVACTKCHLTGGTFKGVKFASCASCHQTPHPPAMSTQCTTCHTSDSWHTRKFDHSRTAFPLVGRHSTVDCAACHKAPATKVKPAAATCATCHADPHKGEFKQDCKACHSENGFTGAVFDHAKATGFGLTDGHAGLVCQRCHAGVAVQNVPLAKKAADFRGLKPACATCHDDPHKKELGASCTSCHTTKTFSVTTFAHPQAQELFVGKHAALACDACHKPAAPARGSPPARAVTGLKATPTACASCHEDVHLGQVGTECQSCHSASGTTFAADRFSHDRASFHLTGAHQKVACEKCHKSEAAAFPAGRGTAVRLAGLGATCASCHADVHLGQVSQTCETCHSTNAFTVGRYAHQSPPSGFFAGRHTTARCVDCHKPSTGDFPAGHGTAVRFQVSAQCVACHTDVHKGALGQDCARCHRPEPLARSHMRVSP
ncbi:MAG TPA: hypothetical protein VLT86_19530 [Vicinamibacterales bacterium]|nr:hypothetical protein [Vicinamibacterales bacterium]